MLPKTTLFVLQFLLLITINSLPIITKNLKRKTTVHKCPEKESANILFLLNAQQPADSLATEIDVLERTVEHYAISKRLRISILTYSGNEIDILLPFDEGIDSKSVKIALERLRNNAHHLLRSNSNVGGGGGRLNSQIINGVLKCFLSANNKQALRLLVIFANGKTSIQDDWLLRAELASMKLEHVRILLITENVDDNDFEFLPSQPYDDYRLSLKNSSVSSITKIISSLLISATKPFDVFITSDSRHNKLLHNDGNHPHLLTDARRQVCGNLLRKMSSENDCNTCLLNDLPYFDIGQKKLLLFLSDQQDGRIDKRLLTSFTNLSRTAFVCIGTDEIVAHRLRPICGKKSTWNLQHGQFKSKRFGKFIDREMKKLCVE